MLEHTGTDRWLWDGWRWSEFAAGRCLQVRTPCLSYTVSKMVNRRGYEVVVIFFCYRVATLEG